MRHCMTSILLILSLLILSGNVAWCEDSSSSPPLKLQHAPQPAQDSPQQVEEIRDISGPVPISDTSRFLIPMVAAFALLIIAILVFFFLKRRQKTTVKISTPDILALTELDQARNLMAQPLVYAEQVSTILRQYIESRFQIHSTRQTTQEFFSSLNSGMTVTEMDITSQTGNLQECMEQCDLAKFAHGTPNQGRMIGMDLAVRNFIEMTRPKETP